MRVLRYFFRKMKFIFIKFMLYDSYYFDFSYLYERRVKYVISNFKNEKNDLNFAGWRAYSFLCIVCVFATVLFLIKAVKVIKFSELNTVVSK